MSALDKLQDISKKNKSLICLGLDLDPKKMPHDLANSTKGMFEFAQRIIEATKDLVCAYKPNLAFYENMGHEGISLLRLLVERIPKEIPVILDGKRGDIANTANQYASFMFEHLGGDWVTLNPYMGYDSMRPFLEYKNKGAFVLCLTSNPGSRDFQQLPVEGKPLYLVVAEKVAYWNKDNNLGLVVGATHPEQLSGIREIAGDMPLLIPGVGAQGGALEKAVLDGTANFTRTALINVSRSVLYASNGADFAERSRSELIKLNGIVNNCRTDQSGTPTEQRPSGQPGRPPKPQQERQNQGDRSGPNHHSGNSGHSNQNNHRQGRPSGPPNNHQQSPPRDNRPDTSQGQQDAGERVQKDSQHQQE